LQFHHNLVLYLVCILPERSSATSHALEANLTRMQLAWVCLLNIYALTTTLHDLLRLAGAAPQFARLLSVLGASAVLAAWLLLDVDTWGWIFQDAMGIVYVVFVLRLGLLPNLKVLPSLQVRLAADRHLLVSIIPERHVCPSQHYCLWP